MGLADFLAQAAHGGLGAAMGGKTKQQQFVENDLPALLQEIHANTDETKIPELGTKFLTAASKAGLSAQGTEKLMHMAIGPALQGIRNEGLNKLFNQYRGQPEQPAESRPEINGVPKEGPLTPSGNFVDPKAATPDKPLDLNFINKFGQLTGANPEQYNKMLETPSTIAGKQLGNQKTQQAIDQETAAQKAIDELSNEPPAPGQPSSRQVARINRPGIVQFLDQRTKPPDPLEQKRGEVMDAQIRNLTHLANRPYPEPGGTAHGSGEYQDYVKLLPPGQTPSMEGFQAYLEQRRGAGKTNETTADQAYGSLDREIDLHAIAQEAHASGKTSAADIKAMAAKRGLVVEGEPQLTVSGGAFGIGATPILTGDFEFKKKPRVTTKTKAGATGDQGRYDEVPSGSAPVPRNSKAGGAGSGGGSGSGSKPQRMKFDAQGNLVK